MGLIMRKHKSMQKRPQTTIFSLFHNIKPHTVTTIKKKKKKANAAINRKDLTESTHTCTHEWEGSGSPPCFAQQRTLKTLS